MLQCKFRFGKDRLKRRNVILSNLICLLFINHYEDIGSLADPSIQARKPPLVVQLFPTRHVCSDQPCIHPNAAQHCKTHPSITTALDNAGSVAWAQEAANLQLLVVVISGSSATNAVNGEACRAPPSQSQLHKLFYKMVVIAPT